LNNAGKEKDFEFGEQEVSTILKKVLSIKELKLLLRIFIPQTFLPNKIINSKNLNYHSMNPVFLMFKKIHTILQVFLQNLLKQNP